ncbi:hypothetical protein GCM10010519_76900 [Streptomyces lactacystinicus]
MLNRISGISACGGCGKRVLDPATGVIHARSSRGYAVTIGLVRCGRIWFCPECSATIRRGRTEELMTAALRHLAAGGTLAVVTLTARHNHTVELGRLSDALWGSPLLDKAGAPVLDSSGRARRKPGAYQTMLTDPAFYGRPETVSTWTRKDGTVGASVRPAEDGIRHSIGYIGMARASEVTRSQANGWHPHMGCLAFLGATVEGTPANGTVDKDGYFEPAEEDLEAWEDWLRDLWAKSLGKADPKFKPSTSCEIRDCKCGGKGHAVKVQIIRSPDDAALIEYLTKVQDGKPADRPSADDVRADLDAARGAALETANASSKTGRGRKTMTPFQMLYRLWDIEVGGLDPRQAEGYGTPARLRKWWAEYETAMAGRRAIEWTRGLRRHLGMTGDDSEERDLQFIYEQQKRDPLTGGVVVTTDAHAAVVGADAEMDVKAAVEAEAYDSVADLVVAAGGRHDHVRLATAQEIADTEAALYARVIARREELDRQAELAEKRGGRAEGWHRQNAERHRAKYDALETERKAFLAAAKGAADARQDAADDPQTRGRATA